MQTKEQANLLGHSLACTGKTLGIQTSAFLTDMTQPLGRMVGNANEVLESLEVLKGDGPQDVRELTIELCAQLMLDTRITSSLEDARCRCLAVLKNGHAFERFEKMVAAQVGISASWCV